VTGEAPAELQRTGRYRPLAPGVIDGGKDFRAAAVVQRGDAAQMVCLNRVRRVCARAAVITHYSGQAVWRVAVCGGVTHVSCSQDENRNIIRQGYQKVRTREASRGLMFMLNDPTTSP